MDTTLQALFEAYQEHPIAYMPIYSRITGSVTAGILLSQIVYWDGKVKHRQFYKTDKEFSEELSMGASELKNAKKRLIKMGLIEIVRKGIPARTHYKLNLGRLSDLITTSVKKNATVSRKSPNKINQNEPTNTDTTQKITPDNFIYDGFLESKNVSHKDTIEKYLASSPSEHEEVNNAVLDYLEYYSQYMQHTHPPITEKQYDRTIERLESISDEFHLTESEFRTIMESWFTDENVKSNYNIIHFAQEGVIRTHYYKSVY